MSVDLPEPFRTALAGARPGEVCDHEAETPEALYGRALARIQVGRDRDARADLERSLPALGDRCRIELAYLDVRGRESLAGGLELAQEILDRARPGSPLRARALHILGLARGKLRRTAAATDALIEASEAYRQLGDPGGRARVRDTLGMLHASQGRLDLALGAYAIALAEKVLAGDRYGMAITLGNLGRACLKAGRCRDALDYFELSHRLAGEMGDRRGCARMLNDMGRARMGLEDLARAEADLRAGLALAQESGYREVEFFAGKDLALALIAQGRLDEAARQIELAEKALPEGAGPDLRSHLLAARGELLLARREPEALRVLEDAVRVFGETDLPDHEIPLRMTLARAYVEAKLKRMAEVCLETALERARRDGFERYLRPIREAMAELGWSGRLEEEEARVAAPESSETPPDGYVLLERLGSGAFGEVYRAFDPLRDQLVALKRFGLAKSYDVKRRRDLLTSARLELEAASRIRHPGVARVFAIGYDRGGNAYVVQEFVKGRTLRRLMESVRPPELAVVAQKTQLVAEALVALHHHQVVHRDLKPENIILRVPDEAPVLVDFGIAHVAGSEAGFGARGVAGTLPYIAPELFEGSRATSKADLYSLGVLLHEWLSGKLPWEPAATEWSRGLEERRRAKLPSLASACPGLPAEIVDLVDRLLDADPGRRPGAGEVAEACAEFRERQTAGSAPGLSALALDLTENLGTAP